MWRMGRRIILHASRNRLRRFVIRGGMEFIAIFRICVIGWHYCICCWTMGPSLDHNRYLSCLLSTCPCQGYSWVKSHWCLSPFDFPSGFHDRYYLLDHVFWFDDTVLILASCRVDLSTDLRISPVWRLNLDYSLPIWLCLVCVAVGSCAICGLSCVSSSTVAAVKWRFY